LSNSPHLQEETAAAQLVHAFKLEAVQLPSSKLIAPQLYSNDPEKAAEMLKKDPSLSFTMMRELASRLFTPERLNLEQAAAYIKAARPGVVGLPLLEDLAAMESAAKKKKLGPQKPTEQLNGLGTGMQ